MAHDDQFTAVGPPLAGSGKPFSGFSTSATGMVYGLNVQGDRCGVYGESLRGEGNRESFNEGVGVHGSGENFGVVGSGNRGIAGVYGQNQSGRIGAIGAAAPDGTGVVGASLRSVGNPLATWQTIPSTSSGGSGTGVWGISGTGIGVHGDSESNTGVFGHSSSGFAVHGISENSIGAHGESGSNTGVFGHSTSGIGVHGNSESNTGVFGHSTSGFAVHGISEDNIGVRGEGITGVEGHSTFGYGVRGFSEQFIGVEGLSNSNIGVRGHSDSGTGVQGESTSGLAGLFFGNVEVRGNLSATGTKPFVQVHPTDPDKEIVYIALEGGEAGTYVRGSGQLESGKAVLALPEHFGLVTESSGLTVQLTPRGQWLQLYVVELDTAQLVVREAQGKSGAFDYLIQGVRRGYEQHEVIRTKR